MSFLTIQPLKELSQPVSLSISNLSTFDFKLVKSTFLANFDVSIPVVHFKSAFVA